MTETWNVHDDVSRFDTEPASTQQTGPLTWLDDMPLIPIDENECLMEDYTA